jgi:hypothetical protein
LLRNFLSARDQTLVERFVTTLGAKFTRDLVREVLVKIDTLNAPLLQKAASSPALSSAGDFASIRHDISADRVCKTGIGDSGRSISG